MRIESITQSRADRETIDKDLSNGLEKAFLQEMLKHAGPKPMSGSFSGGIGEEQFAGFLIEAHAEALASRLDFRLIGPGIRP
ncbi:hypothetical protein RGQ15_00545 [Paracoccus sp. MBLB3053]|uniref:Flagellar protein FlgJ N-terminal domain-containing protein n=1 Tax=Paracoccus aurantius TaxID=3073814 RepID=A0ABU2HNC2_9RHOB|nr:hypothetical protein [Paracoccus sp. MBLB3053]MDS9466065.1 hypothetical protein [Paracoccus sp. MBLB3053]